MENYIVPDKVYVLNKNEVLLAVFDKDDEEPIINPQIQKTQNAESVFTFSISPNNPKWLQINNPENLYVADGKVYSTNFEGCFTEVVSENNEDLVQVTAYERQKLLSRKFVRAWNSETGFEVIDSFMVVILSNGDLPLKNNGTIVNTTYQKGTSGYVLEGLLYGTGWSVGTCDVQGTFDFETEQVDIYENILKVQEIWGGILVFDSINKVVHHRDETTWLPYNGYEVKYQKNMQSLEKLYNNRIITKLCPLGEGGLNIKSVNNNSEWLTNYTYTDTVLEGIENNPDIYDAEQLKRWGQRKLQDLCKPRTELSVKAVLLYQVEGYELERVDLNDIVDVIRIEGSDRDITQLRVVGFTYKLWDYSDAMLELSDITLDSTDIFKKNVQATNQINAGTLDTTQVVSFFRAGQTVEKSLRNIDNAVAEIIINEDSIVYAVKNGGLNLLKGTNNTDWKSVSCSRYAGPSPALPNLTDIADLGLLSGDKITYSLYIKSTSGKKLRARISFYDSNSSVISPSAYADNNHIIENSEGFSYAVGTIPENCKYIALWIDSNLTAQTITTMTTEYVKAEKLEKGAIPTTWTPAIGDYSTSTEVVQTAEGITSTALKNLELGGTNLLLDSANKSINNLNSTPGSRKEYGNIDFGQSYMNVKDGEKVTLSFDLEMQVNTENPYLLIYNDNKKGPKHFNSKYLRFSASVGSIIKQRCNVTSTISDRENPTLTNNFIEFYSNYGSSNWFKITNPKLERGEKATDWSPAPEDMATATQLSTVVSQTATQLSLTAQEKSSGTQCGITIKLKNADGTELMSGEANITLSGLVKFTDLSTSGSTTINGSNITTGIIKSSNYVSGTSGTLINLNTGVIDNKNFKISSNGDVTLNNATLTGGTIKSANYVSGTNGTLINLNTGVIDNKNFKISSNGDVTLNNATLTGGTIKSANYVSGTSGTSINLNTGVIDSKNFKVTSTGNITATAGTVGGFTITDSKIYKTKSSLTSASDGVYIGIDGIALGASSAFKVTNTGAVTCNNISITGGTIDLISNATSYANAKIKCISGTGTTAFKSYYSAMGLDFTGDSSQTIPKQISIALNSGTNEPEIDLIAHNLASDTQIKPSGITTPQVNQTSLATSKKNFEKLTDGLNIIKDIDIYKYNLKFEEDTIKKHIGFVIGDKYKYSQEITSNENNSVDIYSFVAVCCKAIQELAEEIERLKKRG